jgi:NADP-dependent 3-hydroxy acid dehydrogenase YdfG
MLPLVSQASKDAGRAALAIVSGAAGAFGQDYCRALAREGYAVLAADLAPPDGGRLVP